MSRPTVVPFADEHLEAAAALLAARHAAQRAVEPLLPARYEDPAAARAEVEAARGTEGATGAVALVDGRVAAYLIGAPRGDAIWGPNVWVEFAGHAAEEPELVRDLYGALAASWVERGSTRHYVLVPATDPTLVEAWYRLSFGQQHALGIQEVPREGPSSAVGIELRPPTEADLDDLIRLDLALPEHQERSPVFSPVPRPNLEELRAEWVADLDKSEEGLFLACRDGRAVGLLAVAPVELSSVHVGLARPDDACILGFAATDPGARGTGVGLALTAAAFEWARTHGFSTIVTDYRVTNLLSSRFWPRRGFRPTFLRLYRSIP